MGSLVDWVAPQTEDSAARRFLYSSVFWLLVGVLLGLTMVVKVLVPDLLGGVAWLSFGRIRQIHVDLGLFGFLSAALLAAACFVVPRLCRAPLAGERAANLAVWAWNAAAALAVITLAGGQTRGREWGEAVWSVDLLRLAAFVLLWFAVFRTIRRRRSPEMYVTLWYLAAALVWGPMVLFFGKGLWAPATPYAGVVEALAGWFTGHGMITLWAGALALGVAYYLVPRLSGNPLYSVTLAAVGFYGLALFGPFAGPLPSVGGPAPYWLQTVAVVAGVMLLIPGLSAATNLWRTLGGAWDRVRADVALAFAVVGILAYLLSVVQGALAALRVVHNFLAFTQWGAGQTMLTLGLAYGSFALAAVYHMLPAVTGRRLYSERLAWWHFWLSVLGWVVFLSLFWVAGLVEGVMWNAGATPFIASVKATVPLWAGRLVAGTAIVTAQVLFAYNVYSTAVAGTTVPAAEREREAVATA
ncbi:MAG: cbb3-type cytochrome c oxidase subunit I [Armatimonadetes bacterium]|nr:cbb3-type cytochrome c oxidase subunit I [Armatimonadota bacterium]